MKRFVVLCLATLFFLSAFCGCEFLRETPENETESGGQNFQNEIFFEDKDEIKQYEYFKDVIGQNSYDKWLATEVRKGEFSDVQIYSKYLALWINELEFTVNNSEDFFEYESQYDNWKNCVNQWSESFLDVLETEIDLLGNDEAAQLVIYTSRCNLLRMKVIDTKFFICRMQYLALAAEGHNTQITIVWAPEANMVDFDAALSDDETKHAPNSVFDSETAILIDHFNDNISEYISDDNQLLSINQEKYGDENWLSPYLICISYWQENEYIAAIESGEMLFVNPSEYERWEFSVKQLMESSELLFNCEYSIIIPDGPRAYISKLDLIRKEVICQKLFLYYREYQQTIAQGESSPQIAVRWATK